MTPINASMRSDTRIRDTRKPPVKQERQETGSDYNEETRRAIMEARQGIGLTKAYRSAAELFAALDAEDVEDVAD